MIVSEEAKQRKRDHQKEYAKTEAGKAVTRKYRSSVKGKIAIERHIKSDKRKETCDAWKLTPNGQAYLESRRIKSIEYRKIPEVRESRLEYMKQWHIDNPVSPDEYKDGRLQRIYGITLDEYNELLIKQNYSCKICGKHESEFDRKLSVDHNHTTGKIRGLLCGNCNTGLGLFKDNKELLLKSVDYLKEDEDARK